jgi:DNA invertase Pin-like site-specific DNA recombinase
MPARKSVIYARVSTSNESVLNQVLELREAAQRLGCMVVTEIVDQGISGAKGRSDRQGFDRVVRMIQRREIDVVMTWSIGGLGRSIQDLMGFMREVQSAGIDLYIHAQAINTLTPAGRTVFGIFSALGELEREQIRERINAGIARAKAEGRHGGRPSVWNTPTVLASVKLLRERGMSIHAISKNLRIGVGTTQKILREIA